MRGPICSAHMYKEPITMDHLVQFFKETNLTLRWFSAEAGESSHRELKNVEIRHGLIIKNKKKFGRQGHKKKTTKAGFIFNPRNLEFVPEMLTGVQETSPVLLDHGYAGT